METQNQGASARRIPVAGADFERAAVPELVARLARPARAPLSQVDADELPRLARAGPNELQRRLGVGPRAAERLVAAFELGRRVELARMDARLDVRRPEAVQRLLAPRVRGLTRETFWSLLLDGRHRLQSIESISVGTLTSSLVHPREVFGPALRAAAAAVVVAHNHPSGDPSPSEQDFEVTRRLRRSGELLGVPLLDHVVLGDGTWRSLREMGAWT